MPRVRLNDKFTYQNESYTMRLGGTLGDSNSNLYKESNVPIFFPTFNFPILGATHNDRVGNRITVTSIRFKATLQLTWQFVSNSGNPFGGGTFTNSTYPQKRFYKLRYMVVQLDDDIPATQTVNEAWFYKWFKRSYTWCIPNTTAIADDYANAPVSTHANLLHSTTPYVAKFNILCDKCFTLTSTKPQISLDITLPLNKEFCWEEGSDTNLLYPHLYMFILPPLNGIVDMDINTQKNMSITNLPEDFIRIDSFTKLSFVDL